MDGFLDKNELRSELSLAFVCSELGILLDENATACCPFHDDHKPSFEVWTDGSGVERFSCYPCGIRGDVYDLLQLARGLTFTDALLEAEEMHSHQPEGYTHVASTRERVLFDPAVAGQLVEESWARARENAGWLCVVTGVVPEDFPLDYRCQVDEFILQVWRLGVDHAGNTVFPHYDSLGQLTGVKFRSVEGRRWAFPGSVFTSLYGGWHARRSRNVLLCEGETDAIFASLQDPPVDVLALPAGAGKFIETWTLLEADTYFLVFDADDAGDEAVSRWTKELSGRDVRVCTLPRGYDLRDVRGDVNRLMADALPAVIG